MQGDRSLHVGLVCPAWPVEEYQNGIVTYVHALRAELLRQGHRVSVFTGLLGRRADDAGVHRIGVPLQYRVLRRFTGGRMGTHELAHRGKAIAAKIKAVHARDPIDVVEMEEFYGWCADVSRKAPVPVVVKLHGPAFLTLADQETKPVQARIRGEGRALKRMQAIIAPSRTTLESTVSRYALAPAIREVVPNPLTLEPGTASWDLERCGRKTLLFVGRFDRLKGGDLVLGAYRKLLAADPSVRLVFVGRDDGIAAPGAGRVFFEQYKASLFTPAQAASITYRNFVPRPELFGLRTRALVTIVASRWENQPNTALEAMLQGCPLVGVDAGGMSEIVQHGVTGLLARPDDVDDLSAKLASLIANPAAARQMGANARRWVAEHHAPERLVRKNLDVYRRAIAMRQPAAT